MFRDPILICKYIPIEKLYRRKLTEHSRVSQLHLSTQGQFGLGVSKKSSKIRHRHILPSSKKVPSISEGQCRIPRSNPIEPQRNSDRQLIGIECFWECNCACRRTLYLSAQRLLRSLHSGCSTSLLQYSSIARSCALDHQLIISKGKSLTIDPLQSPY